MNKKLLAAAIGLAIAAPAFAQSSNVTLYGRINTSFEGDTTSGARSSGLVRSNASRLGVKGTEDLGNGLKGVFGIETSLASDSGASGLGGSLRNAYLGLATQAGTVALGRLDVAAPGGAPAYAAFAAVWSDINHDNGTTGLTQTDGAGTFNAAHPADRAMFGIRTRSSNAFSYAAPEFVPGLAIHARYAMTGTDNGTLINNTPAGTTNTYENDLRDIELAAIYKTGNLAVTGAFTDQRIKNVGVLTNNVDYRYQLGAGYNFGVVKVGGLFGRTRYEQVSAGNKGDTNEYGLSLAAPFGANTVIFNYAGRQLQGRETAAAGGLGRDRVLQLGYNYNFSPRTRAYAFYQNRDFNTSSNVEPTSGSAVISAGTTTAIKTFGVGVRHNF